jgi:predicted amidohydrolase
VHPARTVLPRAREAPHEDRSARDPARSDRLIPFTVAALQLELAADRDNFERIAARVEQTMALYPFVDLVLLSELATLGPSPGRAQPLPGPSEHAYQELAARLGVWLLPGTLFERRGDHVYNTASVIDPHGKLVGRYRKLFPFRPYEAGVEGGDEFLVFDVPRVGRFGVSICYDLWFPETARTLAAMGAEVILHPTMTNTIDRDVELSIVRATAAQQQCYVFDVNGLGGGGNGRSLVVGPDGDVLHQAGTHEEIIPMEIDLERPRRAREVGLRHLGQLLKSFRDRKVDFPVYDRKARGFDYLDRLGPLKRAERGSRAGLGRTPK